MILSRSAKTTTLKQVLVIKLGTAAITLPNGHLNEPLLANLAAQMAGLHQRYHLLLVSSGAVGSGKPFVQPWRGTINQKKAAAAIGNPLLMASYARHFLPHNIITAQCLLERGHFNRRKHFVQLRQTIHELWENGIIPIANDNDVVNDMELRFSDNDELATLLAVAFDAEKLLIGSSVDGLMDAEGAVMAEVAEMDSAIFSLVRPEQSAQGLGGMFSKLSHTRRATALGIETTIFNAKTPGNLTAAFEGKSGTRFLPRKSNLNARQKWLQSGRTHGTLVVDDGAATALLARKSLLAVGIKKVASAFVAGELVEVADSSGNILAIGKSRVDSHAINTGTRAQVVLHANDLLLTLHE